MNAQPPNTSDATVSPALQQWLQQGEALYDSAMVEYHAMETQLEELEAKLVNKRSEVNQIAQIIGKPSADGNRRVSAQLMGENRTTDERGPAHIAKALAGKFGR